MKKIFLFITAFSISILNAQDISDGLRYGQQDIKGTARYRSMSGAFGALGGDLSAIHVNPAGSAVFSNSYASLTLSNTDISNDAWLGNGFNTSNTSSFNFNQLGAVFTYSHPIKEHPINKLALAFTYDQTSDNVDEIIGFGTTNNSIDSFFLGTAQGIPLDLITPRSGESINDLYSFLGETQGTNAQTAFLGHESFLIEAVNPDNPDNTDYVSNVAPGNFDQEYQLESTGLNGKFTINGSIQIQKRFYVGGSLNFHFINYDRTTNFFERNDNVDSSINDIIFTNKLSTLGSGISAQIGGIAKVSKMLRLGLSLESPTWHTIQEETTQRLETSSNANGTAIVNPNIINLFPEYQLRTPGRAIASAAILFDNKGLISIDYSYKDHRNTSFDSEQGNNEFSDLNNRIDQALQAASSIRIGGELRNGQWSFRGGILYEESPYKDDLILGEKTGASLGIGYNFGKFKFDVAYDYAEQDRTEAPYPTSNISNLVSITNFRDTLTFTLGLNL